MKASLENAIRHHTRYASLLLGIIAFISLFIKYGFHLSDGVILTLVILDEIIAGCFVAIIFLNYLFSQKKWNYIKESPVEMILMTLFIVSIVLEEILSIEEPHYILKRATTHNFIKLYFVVVQVYIVANGIIALTRARDKWLYLSLSPARIMVTSYLLVILVGTLVLKLPNATYDGISWIDAFFTSTSAVCITGLNTVNVAQFFTFEGQVIIMVIIQLGGLGIITLTSFIALFVQRGLQLRDQVIVQEMFDSDDFSTLGSMLKAIITITLLSELIGAIGLYAAWGGLGLPEFEQIFSDVFHSVSAYCNAGFSIFPEGFETQGMVFSHISMILVMLLIIAGGLGFYTYYDIFNMGGVSGFRKKDLEEMLKDIE